MKKALIDVLTGGKPARTPIWLMRQAGRYLPEYREMRKKAGSFMKLCFTPEMAAEVTLQPVRRFGMDGAILFSDILIVPHSLGLALDFIEGEGPKLETVRETIPAFDQKSFFERSAPIYETVKQVKKHLPDNAAMIGFAGSPFTVACYMLGGKGADQFEKARLRAMENKAFFEKLLATLVESTSFYLIEQIKAGAEVIQLFDSWSGLVPTRYFYSWVIAPTRHIVANLKASHPSIPVIGFPRGAGVNLKAYAEQTGVDALSLDQSVDLGWAQENITCALQGNLDPLAMRAAEATLLHEAEAVCAAMKRPFIFNLGHGLTPDVPPENVAALVTFVHSYKGDSGLGTRD